MAKTNRSNVQANAITESAEEMVVFALRIKGGGNTLQKGFDALTHAFAAMGPASGSGMTPRRLGTTGAQIQSPQDDGEEQGSSETDGAETVLEATSNAPVSATKRGPRKYKYNDNLDLSQSDKSWKDFATEKAPGSDNKCYLVAAQWLTENVKMAEFGIADVFTLFRAMKWNEQADFSQPLRKMKSNSSYFDNPTPKTWKLTKIGLDAAKEIAEGQ